MTETSLMSPHIYSSLGSPCRLRKKVRQHRAPVCFLHDELHVAWVFLRGKGSSCLASLYLSLSGGQCTVDR